MEYETLHSYDLLGVGPSFSMFVRPLNQPLEIEHKEFLFRDINTHLLNVKGNRCSLLEVRCLDFVLQAVTYCSLFTVVIPIGTPFMPLVLLVRQQHVLKSVRCYCQSHLHRYE